MRRSTGGEMEGIAVGVGRVGGEVTGIGRLVVAHVRRAAAQHRAAHPRAAKVSQEEPLELVAQDAVDDEIHLQFKYNRYTSIFLNFS